MKSVLLATRPLVPPWDEASKNFAYFLGREVRAQALTLLTTSTPLEGLPKSTRQEDIFSRGHFGLRAKLELLRYLRQARSGYDITHYLFTPAKQNTAFIKRFALPTRGKTLQTVATVRDDLYSPAELRQLFFADHLVTYTDRSKEKLRDLGFSSVTRVYPGIDLGRFVPKEKDATLLTQWGLDRWHFLLVYPGEYVRLGATDFLAETFIRFFQAQPDTDVRLVFACRVKNEADARKKEAIKARFAALGLSRFVVYSDTVADMPALYNTADVVLFPVANLSGKFDVPLIIIEAYACGKPVILSDLPQFSEFSNDRICVTIPSDSSERLLESVAYLKANGAHRQAVGQAARAFVEEHFDLKDTARRYEQIYASL